MVGSIFACPKGYTRMLGDYPGCGYNQCRKVSNIEECKAQCSNDSHCKSFQYHEDGTCRLQDRSSIPTTDQNNSTFCCKGMPNGVCSTCPIGFTWMLGDIGGCGDVRGCSNPIKVPTIDDCVAQCKLFDCKSFQYSPHNQNCFLHKKSYKPTSTDILTHVCCRGKPSDNCVASPLQQHPIRIPIVPVPPSAVSNSLSQPSTTILYSPSPAVTATPATPSTPAATTPSTPAATTPSTPATTTPSPTPTTPSTPATPSTADTPKNEAEDSMEGHEYNTLIGIFLCYSCTSIVLAIYIIAQYEAKKC